MQAGGQSLSVHEHATVFGLIRYRIGMLIENGIKLLSFHRRRSGVRFTNAAKNGCLWDSIR